MLVGACLEALVGIGDESSLAASGGASRTCDAAGLLSGVLPESHGRSGIGQEFAEVANLLPVRGPHLRPAILGALIAIHPRCPCRTPTRTCCRPYGRWWKMEILRCAAIRRCGFWAFCRLVTTFTRSWSPACPAPNGWFVWGRLNSSEDRTARGGDSSCRARARRNR